jgi:hypothetical protein
MALVNPAELATSVKRENGGNPPGGSDFANADPRRKGKAQAAAAPRCRKLRRVHLPIHGVVTIVDHR